MHLPIANNLASRDGTTAKDEGGRNVVIETDGEASVCLKRPGALSLGAVGTGVGQLLACYNNQLKSIVGNTLADLIVTILAPGPGTPGTPGAGTYKTLPSAGASSWTCVASDGSGGFASVLQTGASSAKSSDGQTWTSGGAMPFTPSISWQNMGYGAGKYLCIPFSDALFRYAYSSNGGSTWFQGNFPSALSGSRVRFLNGLFVVVGTNNKIFTSPDGTTWTTRTISGYPSGTPFFYDVAYGNGVYVFYSKTSTNGITVYTSKTADFSAWTHVAQPSNPYIDSTGASNDCIIFDGNKFVIPCNGTSTDGVTWVTPAPSIPIDRLINTFVFAGGIYVAGMSDAIDDNFLATSTDGFIWTDLMYLGATNWLFSMAVGGGKVFAMDTLGDRVVEAYPFNGTPGTPGTPGGPVATVESSQALNPVIADKPFISQMAIKSTGEKITVIKTAHEAWVYK